MTSLTNITKCWSVTSQWDCVILLTGIIIHNIQLFMFSVLCCTTLKRENVKTFQSTLSELKEKRAKLGHEFVIDLTVSLYFDVHVFYKQYKQPGWNWPKSKKPDKQLLRLRFVEEVNKPDVVCKAGKSWTPGHE